MVEIPLYKRCERPSHKPVSSSKPAKNEPMLPAVDTLPAVVPLASEKLIVNTPGTSLPTEEASRPL